MATDPVERIHSEEVQTPFTAKLRERIVELAYMEPSVEHPYISTYVDWRPEGESPGVRPGKTTLEHEIAKRRRELNQAGIDTREFDADAERITHFLEDGIDPAVHGIFILSCEARDLFESVFLALPFETSMTLGPTPHLRQLMAIVEGHPRFAVLHADQHEAALFVVSRASPQMQTSLESTDYPRRQSSGGWSQRRFQARADERVQHFARAVAEELRRVVDEEDIEMVVLSVGEVFGSALNDELHSSIKSRIVGEISVDRNASESQIIEKADHVVVQADRNHEAEDIRNLEDAIGAGHQGAAGIQEVLRALQNGQVMTLLMAEDFEASGWADYGMNMYGEGDPPTEHPAGGDVNELVPINLAEELVRLALSTGASVEIIASAEAARLHKHQGVGALLRY